MSVFHNFDSLHVGKLLNYFSGTLHSDSLSICDAVMENYGSIEIYFDYSNACGANSSNYKYFYIGRDFSNDTTSVFYTECMVHIGRNWSNVGMINGPASGCGGFSVAGLTGNFGAFGNSGNVDMCDEGGPTGGFDINTGTTGAGVTYCVCTDTCVYDYGIKENNTAQSGINIVNIYPNPFLDKINIDISSATLKKISLSLYNIYGQLLKNESLNLYKGVHIYEIEASGIADGVYMIVFAGENYLRSFSVIKHKQ
jgi:hypothetical protein